MPIGGAGNFSISIAKVFRVYQITLKLLGVKRWYQKLFVFIWAHARNGGS